MAVFSDFPSCKQMAKTTHVCLWKSLGTSIYTLLYSLTKEHPWAGNLTSLPKRGMGALLSVSAFNHEIAPMWHLQQLDTLKTNNLKNNNVQQSHQGPRSQVLTTF